MSDPSVSGELPTEHVFVLFGNTGEYSDHSEWVVRAYTLQADAEADCAALNGIAKADGDVSYDYHRRNAVVERLRQHDTSATMDYTGTEYFVAGVPLVSQRMIPDANV